MERFSRGVVEALAGHVALLKPQVALYEVYGAAGLAALERTLADAREAGVLTVADAKRGDIGSTMAGYARAWLADDAPLAADALTLSPYLGVGSLAPALDLAVATGRGVFVLARTSNPEAAGVQSAQAWVAGSAGRGSGGAPMREVAQSVIDALADHNAAHRDGPGDGSAGAVVGLTRGTTGRDARSRPVRPRRPRPRPGPGRAGWHARRRGDRVRRPRRARRRHRTGRARQRPGGPHRRPRPRSAESLRSER